MGFAHRRANPEETEGEIRRDLFAVKVLIGESTPADSELLMAESDRSWWREGLGSEATFASEVEKRAEVFRRGGLDRWVRSWVEYSREKV